MIIYVLIIGLKDRRLFSLFVTESAKRKKIVIGVPLAFIVFACVLSYSIISAGFVLNSFPMILSVLIVVFLTLFWSYAKVVEQHAFRKKIKAAELKEGDVLEEMVWRGLSAEEVANIRKQKKTVTIKEGVRFVPVFPITMAVTLWWGNLLVLLF